MADPAFSTHGARQANGGLAAVDCLADAAEAVPDVPVLVDSGARSVPSEDLPVAEFAFPGPLRHRLVAAIVAGVKTTTSGLIAG